MSSCSAGGWGQGEQPPRTFLDFGIMKVPSGSGNSDPICKLQQNITGGQDLAPEEMGVNQTHVILDSVINSCSRENA